MEFNYLPSLEVESQGAQECAMWCSQSQPMSIVRASGASSRLPRRVRQVLTLRHLDKVMDTEGENINPLSQLHRIPRFEVGPASKATKNCRS